MAKGNMVSLVRSAEDRADDMMPSMLSGDNPDVPSGLCLCLTDRELEKLDIESSPERGDILHLMILIQVTACHSDASGERIEAAIIGGRVENESHETMDGEDEPDGG